MLALSLGTLIGVDLHFFQGGGGGGGAQKINDNS